MTTADDLITAHQKDKADKKAIADAANRERENAFLEKFLEMLRVWLPPAIFEMFAPGEAVYSEDIQHTTPQWQEAECPITFDGLKGKLEYTNSTDNYRSRTGRIEFNIPSRSTHSLSLPVSESQPDRHLGNNRKVYMPQPIAREELGEFLEGIRTTLSEVRQIEAVRREQQLGWARKAVLAATTGPDDLAHALEISRQEYPEVDFSAEIAEAEARWMERRIESEAYFARDKAEREENKRLREARKVEARKVWHPFILYELSYTDQNTSGEVDEERIHTLYVVRPRADTHGGWWTSIWQGAIQPVKVFFPLKIALIEVIHPTDTVARRACASDSALGISIIRPPESADFLDAEGPYKFHFDDEPEESDDYPARTAEADDDRIPF